MANQFRTVRCDMWRRDEWFAELQPDAKLIWIYAFTNESTSPAGIYPIALRTVANETGVPIARVREVVDQFSRDGKLYYEDGIIWPVTMRKHQVGELKPTDHLVARIRADLAELTGAPIVDRYNDYYSARPGREQALRRPMEAPSSGAPSTGAPSKGLRTPFEAPSDPLRCPSGAPSKALRLTDTDTFEDKDDKDAAAEPPGALSMARSGAAAPVGAPAEMAETEASEDEAEAAAAEAEAEAHAIAGAVRAYENQIGLISGGHQSGEMAEIIAELHSRGVLGWWQSALNIASDNNARKWSYVRAILGNSLATGMSPGARRPREREQRSGRRSNGSGTGNRLDAAVLAARRKEIDEYDNEAAIARI